jgi:peptidoglycan biosynthesis protein MviN/MurJ (putative lipid II flippase)
MMVSLVSVLINGISAFTMVRIAGFGFAGLALSSSIVSTFSAITLLLLLRGRIGGIHGWQMGVSVVKVALAAVAMGGVCYAVVSGSHSLFQGSAARMADVAAGIPAGVASFYVAAAALRIPELAEVRGSLLKRLNGKPGPLLN